MKKMFCTLLVSVLFFLSSYAIEQEKPLPKEPIQVTVKNRKNQNVIRTLEYNVWHKIPLFRDNYCFFNNDLAMDVSNISSDVSLNAEELDVIQDYLEGNFCRQSNSDEKIDLLYTTVKRLGLFECIKKDTNYVPNVVQQGNNLSVKQNKKTILSNTSIIQMLAESSMTQYIFFLVSCAAIQVTASGLLFAEA